MISEELIKKYKNHLERVNNCDESDLGGLFNKFLGLCACYNMLYVVVPDLLREKGVEVKKDGVDSKMATEYVQQYLTTETIMGVFRKENAKDLLALIKVVKLNLFNIKLDGKGNPKKDVDADLLAELESADEEKICSAILKILYSVRCNTVHGAKDQVEHQRKLLGPVLHLLQSLANLLYSKLTE
ncbi:hypothetical protein [Sphingobacterium multivorum]|uniref:hypothetical protein n=1 Tax=Sphingobacterium multivorum TaxID=28454 RepID=UPI000DFD0F8A|nr:hypothetical protein [Sphingobacterium multivorum]QQT45460.1 hypothetical protein I6J00_01865 [Sphingobacterium multivorum]SUJ26156.1 Uncharacterised protein [Sphingobacterium multivorum]HBI86274.1 hypothetical protein [Sphingobacterium sp.]